MVLIIISSILSNSIVLIQNKKYEKIYKNLNGKNIEIVGVIVSEEKDKYKIKTSLKEFKNIYFYLKCDEELTYGNEVKIYGNYEAPNQVRNYRGFNYRNYLKTLKIVGTIKSEKVEITKKESTKISTKINKISIAISDKIDTFKLQKEEKAILKGLLLGDKSNLEETTISDFSDSNISHILAISGMHISYIILIISFIFNSLIGKHFSKILTSMFVVFYMYLTKFPLTLVRAGISGIILIMSNFFYRKNDLWQSLGLSLIIILIYNPFSILNIGLQLSYLAIIGIVTFQKTLKKSIKIYLERLNSRAIRKKWNRSKIFLRLINSKIVTIMIDSFLLTISCMITITPILLYNFNTLNVFGVFLSVLAGFIIGPIIILGIICLIFKFNILELFLSLGLKILIFISKIGPKIPFNKVYLATPNILVVLVYCLIVFLGISILKIKNEKAPNMFQIRVRNIFSLVKYKIKSNKNKFISVVLLICLCLVFYSYIPKNLKVYFVDVGQR